jgi:hypothetical protein
MNLETIQIVIGANKHLRENPCDPFLVMCIRHACTPGLRTMQDQYADYLIRRFEVHGK